MAQTIIDLTTPIDAAHFRWKVDRELVRSHAAGDLFEVTRLGWVVHGFTHLDSPRHFAADGFTTDDIALETVMGEAAVVDISRIAPNAPVTETLISEAGAHIREDDIVLMRSGWDTVESINTPEFWTNAPYMTEAASRWLLNRKIKAVAFDFPQDYCIRHLVTGDRQPVLEDNTTHVTLLLNGVIMFEYLCNMLALTQERVHFIGLPLKVPHCDGAPVRAIALQNDPAHGGCQPGST
ncbi:MAG: cyclase family protein [Gammaproteobacteria bacterium]|nr:cyclase family protein [Gammaproteobacteria bacterium]